VISSICPFVYQLFRERSWVIVARSFASAQPISRDLSFVKLLGISGGIISLHAVKRRCVRFVRSAIDVHFVSEELTLREVKLGKLTFGGRTSTDKEVRLG
jgi:hypothetical protein